MSRTSIAKAELRQRVTVDRAATAGVEEIAAVAEDVRAAVDVVADAVVAAAAVEDVTAAVAMEDTVVMAEGGTNANCRLATFD